MEFKSEYEEMLTDHTRELLKSQDKRELRHRANDFYHRISKKAENVIQIQFPKKLLELDGLVSSYSFPTASDIINNSSKAVLQEETDVSEMEDDQNRSKRVKLTTKSGHPRTSRKESAKIIKDSDGTITQYTHHFPSRPEVSRLSEILRREVSELCSSTTEVKLWIQMSIPKIEDGNNFGVQVQEEAINDVARVEDHAFGMLEQVAKYYATRAKIASKIVKYPNLEDYGRSLSEFDLRMVLSLRLYLIDIRNDYALLHDQLMKNLERIKLPRGSSNAVSTMY